MLADKTKQADTMTHLLTKVQFLSDQVESTPENLKHIIASQYEPSERLKTELADLKAVTSGPQMWFSDGAPECLSGAQDHTLGARRDWTVLTAPA